MTHLPIDYGHDPSNKALGWFEQRDGKNLLVFNDSANVTVDMVNKMNGVIASSYRITKEKDGIVLECELLGFSIVPMQKGEKK